MFSLVTKDRVMYSVQAYLVHAADGQCHSKMHEYKHHSPDRPLRTDTVCLLTLPQDNNQHFLRIFLPSTNEDAARIIVSAPWRCLLRTSGYPARASICTTTESEQPQRHVNQSKQDLLSGQTIKIKPVFPPTNQNKTFVPAK